MNFDSTSQQVMAVWSAKLMAEKEIHFNTMQIIDKALSTIREVNFWFIDDWRHTYAKVN